jgi:competence protein ComEC
VGARVLVDWTAVALVAGQLVVTGGRLGADVVVPAAGSLALGCVAAAIVPRWRVGALALAAGFGGAVLVARAATMPRNPDHVGHLGLPLRTRVVGTVVGTPRQDAGRTTFQLDVRTVAGVVRTGQVRVRARGAAPVDRGDVLAIETTLRRPRNFANPGGFDVEGTLARRGLHVVASVWDPATIERIGRVSPSWAVRTLDAWRASVRDAIASQARPEVAAVLRALVVGDESAIDPGLRTAFTRAGVVHVLSVSGLHVAIVIAGAAGLLAWSLGRSERVLLRADPRKLAVPVGLLAALVYGGLAGFAVATVRAVAMAAVVAVAVLLDRRAEPLRALALAAIAVALLQPGAPADVSFQLSFASVAALLLGAQRAEGATRGWIRRALAAATAAWIGTAPLTAFHFHQVSLVSVVANPVIVPLFEAASLLPALAGALLAPVSPTMAGLAFDVASVPIRVALAVVRRVGAWPWAALDVPYPNVVELALLYGVIGGAWHRERRGGRLVAACCLVALAVDAAAWARVRMGPSPRATFLDVGQGDAAVVELAGGRVLVVDAGGFPGSDFDPGAALVEPFLRTRKIQRVDALVMSHAHPDHAGGLAHLVRTMAPAEVWWSGLPATGAAWDAITTALRETGTPVRLLRAGDTVPGFPEVDVLHPPPTWTTASPNEGSLALRVRVGGTAILFTGDAERDAEAAMLDRPEALAATVLKVPHHGSRTSSAAPFVAAVGPELAVASLGAENRFGHPAPDVVARYRAAGVPFARTDRCGAVTVVPDGDGRITVAAERADCDAIRTPRRR